MYIPLILILVLFYGAYALFRYMQKDDQRLVDVVNVCQAVEFLIKDLTIEGMENKEIIDYAFLAQYYFDMQNLDIPSLNAKWIYIYQFFRDRTNHSSGISPTPTYTDHGRLSEETIKTISLLYQVNQNTIGIGILEDLFNIEKETPESIKGFEKMIRKYDAEYTGHVMMNKRNID